jgi:hypothetical protein
VQARGSRLTTIPERSQGARASSDLVNSSIRRPLIPTFGPSYTFVATDPTICCSVVVTNLRCLASCRYVRMVRVHAHCAFFCWFFYTPLSLPLKMLKGNASPVVLPPPDVPPAEPRDAPHADGGPCASLPSLLPPLPPRPSYSAPSAVASAPSSRRLHLPHRILLRAPPPSLLGNGQIWPLPSFLFIGAVVLLAMGQWRWQSVPARRM